MGEKEYEKAPSISQLIDINNRLHKRGKQVQAERDELQKRLTFIQDGHSPYEEIKRLKIECEDSQLTSEIFEIERDMYEDKAKGLQTKIEQLESENKKSKGTCACMNCGKVIKITEQSKHSEECKKANNRLKGSEKEDG